MKPVIVLCRLYCICKLIVDFMKRTEHSDTQLLLLISFVFRTKTYLPLHG